MSDFFATCPKGLELLLVDELKSMGVTDAREKLAGVVFSGDIQLGYRACLWSRLANRILLKLSQFPASTNEQLYQGINKINWDAHLDVDGTLAVHCVCVESKINHSMFAAQKVKDAVVDQFRKKYQRRPSVAKEKPAIQIYVHLHRDVASVYLDLSGESLHKRSYRLDTGAAPLKENLAAAILMRAKWPAIYNEGGSLLDPMCGSGTLLIEGAMMAYDIAPNLSRTYFGFLGWKQFNGKLWQQEKFAAQERKIESSKKKIALVGYDNQSEAIKVAFANIERAGLTGKIHVEKRELEQFDSNLQKIVKGLVVTNPPYGERIGELKELESLYRLLGTQLKKNFIGWKAAVFTGNLDLAKKIGLHSVKQYRLFNGDIDCKLLLFDVDKQHFITR